uniref:Small subunit processome component 20 homolog n=1 Tax=Panagrolaimus sp. ES5 TaxID=591445 RepID=A0AC34GEP5_9BILA
DSLVANIHFPDKSDEGFSHKSLLALILLKRLTTVRGYKTVIQFLPHEVFMLPKLLTVLEYFVAKENLNNLENEAINMLLVWFIIVCRNPFDFHSFAGKGEKSYPDRIRDCLNNLRYLFGKYACLTLAETLTRHADNSEILKPEIDKCLTNLMDEKLDFQKQISDLQLLSIIFKKVRKYGKRPELQKYGKYVFEELKISMLLSSENAGARTHIIKLIQRIALIYLKPKPAAWRYKCGVRSLEENLKASTTDTKNTVLTKYGSNDDVMEEEDITDMEPELERF